MNTEITQTIDQADIPAELRQALHGLLEACDTLRPALPRRPQWNVARSLERVVADATATGTDTHWWEAGLGLIAAIARDQGEAGAPALQATAALEPLLRERLGPYDEVTLPEITSETVRGICLLTETLSETHQAFVAPNAISLAEALFSPYAWYRAVYAGKAAVGFVMLADNPQEEEYFLWRFMIGGPFQGRGYGRQAIERLLDHVRTRPGAKELLTSCGQGEGSPEGFYLRLGFEPTGEWYDDEKILRLVLG